MRFLTFFLVAVVYSAAADQTAERLAHLAEKAEDSGQTVRAYLLFGEAAARDPGNSSYRSRRDALEPVAKLLSQAQVETPDISADLFSAAREAANPVPPIERTTLREWEAEEKLLPIPKVAASAEHYSWNVHLNARTLLEQVAERYGVHALFDRDFHPGAPIHFELQDADFRTSLEGATAATHTFVFPVSSTAIYFAEDTDLKRNELEPQVILTFALPEALTERDLIDAATSVRGLLQMRTVGWDGASRMVMIRDRVTRARIARSVLEALLLPRGQLALEVEFLTLDTDRNYHYGASLQTAYQIIDFGRVGGFKTVLPATLNSSYFGAFGGGATLFGIGLADATAFAMYSKSETQTLYDATVVVADRQTASLHIGDKYPVAQSLYTGYSQSAPSIYYPAPQITLEDLGLVLKITPHINGEGDVNLDVEAQYQTLGTETIDSIPEIGSRQFKGSVNLREGQWAVIAGMDSTMKSVTRSGLAGLFSLPGLNQILSENTRDTQRSDTLIVLKPVITRLPMTDTVSPQYLLGPSRGERVIL